MPRLLHYSDVENVYDDPVRVGRLAGALRSRNGDDALVCGTGDNTSPGVLALIERGRQALDLFRAVDADVETFGNHDFDFGPEATRSIVAAAPQTWVSANVHESGGERFAAPDVVPHAVREVGGVRIGLFGVTDPATPSLNPMAGELRFSDPYDAAEAASTNFGQQGSTASSRSRTSAAGTTNSHGAWTSTLSSAVTSTPNAASGWRTRSCSAPARTATRSSR